MKTTSITHSIRRLSLTDKILVSSVRVSPHATAAIHAVDADSHAVSTQTKEKGLKKVGRNGKKDGTSTKAGNSPTQKCLRTIKRSTFKMRRRFPLPTLLLFLLFTLFILNVHAVPVASTDLDTDEVSTTTKATKTTSSTDKPASTTSDKDDDEETTTSTKSSSKPTKTPASELVEEILLPKNILPFETLGDNFTVSTCQPFITTTIASSEYRDCVALSPLIQNSRTFIAAQRTPSTLSTFLDASCAAPLDPCTSLFHRLSREIRLDTHCGADLRLRNPIVTQAYASFIAYIPLRTAGCLKNKDTNSYCYVEAVESAGKGKGGDLGLYGLPLDEAVPENWGVSCGECTRGTMEGYRLFAGNKSQPLSGRYEAMARRINGACGAGFVDETPAEVTSAAAGGVGLSMVGVMGVVFVVGLLL